jgi:hypothetical protein
VQLGCALLLVAAAIAHAFNAKVTLDWVEILALFVAALIINFPYLRSGKVGPGGIEFIQVAEEPVAQTVKATLEEVDAIPAQTLEEVDAIPALPAATVKNAKGPAVATKPENKADEEQPLETKAETKTGKEPTVERKDAVTSRLTSAAASKSVDPLIGWTPEESDDARIVFRGMLRRLAFAAGVDQGKTAMDTFGNVAATGLLTSQEHARLWLLASDADLRIPTSEFYTYDAPARIRNELAGIVRRVAVKRLTSAIASAAKRHNKTIEMQPLIGSGNRSRRADFRVNGLIIEMVGVVLMPDLQLITEAERFISDAGEQGVVAVAAAFPITSTLAKSAYPCVWLDWDRIEGNEACVKVAGWLFVKHSH